MRIHHYGIEVNDLEISREFYQKMFQLNQESVVEFQGEDLIFLSSNTFCLELIPQKQKRNPEQTTHLCFEVKDIKQMITRFNGHGFEVLEGPYILSNGWQTVFFEGPDHEILEFLEMSGEV
ncbi:VOC family protein [Mesobacillus maritimus]|uniref:VOC family protein n=1 Tax=Mesobacillus maritimus TaxID=1643336 RepID=A0ABS7K1D9_9BACI|nr:VOC family protein [Mesobacillus maritimus]MBY0096041.1 VOC family protein [Mesobacillus maritimus]